MIRKEARQLVKNNAPSRYHGTALVLLTHLVDAAYGPDGVREVTIRASTLMSWVHIGQDQLRRVLDKFTKDGLGTFVGHGGKITVFLNLSPLESLPVKPSLKEAKADRATKARKAYAANKELQMAYAEEHF